MSGERRCNASSFENSTVLCLQGHKHAYVYHKRVAYFMEFIYKMFHFNTIIKYIVAFDL